MPFQAKLPPGGLRAAVERNLADKQQPQDLALESEPQQQDALHFTPFNEGGFVKIERFKTVRLDSQDYEGADSSAGNCPVSRAIRRALCRGPETTIHVWVDRVRINGNLYALPAEVTEADAAWTRDKKVTVLEFQLSNRRMPA